MAELIVVVTEPIHPAGVELLEENGVNVVQLPPGSNEDTLRAEASRVNGLITRGGIKITRSFMESSPGLKAVGVHGIGCDHVDLNAAGELGKVVLNTPNALTESVAEMAMALMLALTRRVVSADKAVRRGEWNRKYGDLRGVEIAGKTLGIIGMGRIGSAVAKRARGFDVKVVYHDVYRREDLEKELGIKHAAIEEVLREADIISLHVPFSPETHHMIGEGELASMKDGVYIVNTARGRIVDQTALVEALKAGKVAGAALDVFEEEPLDPASPLASMDNVILTPHLAASSEEAMRRMAVQAAEGVLKALRGEPPDHPVVI
jgi:D-3-phosphoglycerate dehydrogenase